MIEEGANIDLGLADQRLEEAAEMPNDDYLTIERVEHEHPSEGSDTEQVPDSTA